MKPVKIVGLALSVDTQGKTLSAVRSHCTNNALRRGQSVGSSPPNRQKAKWVTPSSCATLIFAITLRASSYHTVALPTFKKGELLFGSRETRTPCCNAGATRDAHE